MRGFGIARGQVAWRDGDSVALLEPGESLNPLMARGPEAWAEARAAGEAALARGDGVELADDARLPFEVADLVDFYSSLEHATNMGRLLRPEGDPLLPNWRWIPIGYHGRAGTVVVSGTGVRRPHGQRKGEERPEFGPTRRLDIELELGFVIGLPGAGPIPVERALEHVFGVVLVNDWSARDIQAWEYQPLGPFLGKSFATSISAWVTPLDLLTRVPLPPQDPEPLDYLRTEPLGFDIPLEVELNGEVLSRTNARHLYWSVEQQIAHLTSNGASLRTGDLLATGTISGDEPGSLFELWRGERFLEDGDEVVLRGTGLAEVRGKVVS
ncbi:MAG: fumarylacetoacetate hydrolase family protein [Gaiellaceae bacterium]